jgi:ABC-type bacteriocin/lantibiotic exporter with double-glycine peptidase domain
LALPVAIQSLVNSVAFGSVLQPIFVLTVVVSAALLGSAILHVLRFVVLERVQRRIFVRHASDVLDTLMRFRVDVLDRHHAPELVNRFLEVATIQKSASVLVVDGLTVTMQTMAGIALLAAYHPFLLVFDLFLIASIVFVLFVLGRGAVPTAIAESKAKYDVVAWLQEVARHNVMFRSVYGPGMATERTNGLVLDYLQQRSRHFRILLRQVAGSQALQAIALSSILGIGGYLVISGQLTLGQLVAAELVVGVAVNSFVKLGKSLETFYDLQAALEKLEHLTELPLERTNGERARQYEWPATLKIAGVAFGYDEEHPILHDLHLLASPGAKVAIHGTGAAGKSTLLDLIFGLREPHSGRLELNGTAYAHLHLDELRKHTMLLRGTEIFQGTVFDNVAVGTEATPAEVRTALESAGILAAVNALPEGLYTELSPSGRPLSPSQSLRLTFARAFLQRPRLLLVDEALDQIDDLQIDGNLARSLFHVHAPWTLIVATEREELWPLCDRVYQLQDGHLTRHAPHASSSH